MAFIDMTIGSEILNMYVSVAVILPEEKLAEIDGTPKKYPVVYCLHGYKDNYLSWSRKSMLELEARKHKVAVVTPNCPNSFYTDGKNGFNYYDFVTKELPAKICSYFPISPKREDTFIMGVSMGGYGAFMLAMNNPEKYAAAYSFSGPLAIDYKDGLVFGFDKTMAAQVMGAMGTADDFHASRYYLPVVAEKLDKYEGEKPRLKAICGTEDVLCYSYSTAFVEHVRKNTSLNVEYETAPGEHDFFYWNKYLDDAFKFFGIE